VRVSSALGGENIARCVFFLSELLLFSSPFAILLNWFCHNPRVFFASDSPPHPTSKRGGVREQLCGSFLLIAVKPRQRKMKATQCQHISRLFTFFTVAEVASLPHFKKRVNSGLGNVLGGEHVHLCMGGDA